MALMAAFGFAWAAAADRHASLREETVPRADPASPSIWLVDGFNVLHASLLGGRDRSDWWSRARRQEVLELAAQLASDGCARVCVVFDGSQAGDAESPPGVDQVFALSADEWIVRTLQASPEPGQVAVVTADRRLAGRAHSWGARVVAPRDFAARCRERGSATGASG